MLSRLLLGIEYPDHTPNVLYCAQFRCRVTAIYSQGGEKDTGSVCPYPTPSRTHFREGHKGPELEIPSPGFRRI